MPGFLHDLSVSGFLPSILYTCLIFLVSACRSKIALGGLWILSRSSNQSLNHYIWCNQISTFNKLKIGSYIQRAQSLQCCKNILLKMCVCVRVSGNGVVQNSTNDTDKKHFNLNGMSSIGNIEIPNQAVLPFCYILTSSLMSVYSPVTHKWVFSTSLTSLSIKHAVGMVREFQYYNK